MRETGSGGTIRGMKTTQSLTWYGGYVGARSSADNRLHLLRDDGATFCNISAGLRTATRREANAEWCHSCNERAQAVRRDAAGVTA